MYFKVLLLSLLSPRWRAMFSQEWCSDYRWPPDHPKGRSGVYAVDEMTEHLYLLEEITGELDTDRGLQRQAVFP
jgi:hypothetical protein